MLTTALAVLVLSAPAPAVWEKILLPWVTRGPIAGANGSSWETVVTIRNASDKTLAHFPVHCPTFPPNGEKFCVQTFPGLLEPGVTKRVELLDAGPVFLHVTPELADHVFVQLRVHDLSRQSESFGTELPVVRSADMKTNAGQILDIPRDPRFRRTFRLYVDEVETQSSILVRLINELTGERRELRYTLHPRPAEWPKDEPFSRPWLFDQLSDFDASRIEIEPLNEGMRYWAFVCVINNDTQHMTTLTVR